MAGVPQQLRILVPSKYPIRTTLQGEGEGHIAESMLLEITSVPLPARRCPARGCNSLLGTRLIPA